MSKVKTYFFLILDVDEGGAWGRMAEASLRGLPRGRLSAWAGLPVDVAPTLLEGGEGPWSEGSTVLSSDDILKKNGKKDEIMMVVTHSTVKDDMSCENVNPKII